MPPVKRTPLDDVQTVIKNNLFIQYATIIPTVALFIWYFGFYSAWGSILVVAIGYSIRFVSSQKGLFYNNFIEQVPLTTNKREVQHCAWLNLLVRKYWTVCVPKFVEPQIERVNGIMLENKPGWMKKLEIGPWQLGDRAPRITQIYAPIILSDDRYELQFEVMFVPDISAEVHVQPLSALLLKIVGGELKFKAKMKLTFDFNDLFPECSVVSVAFAENPLIELSVRPTRIIDLVSAPFVYELINEITKSNLEPVMVYPNKLQFSLGGGQVETYESMQKPITDIVVIYSETSKAPPGYYLLQRTASGMLAANMNSGNAGKAMYICYAREENKPPITGVCIIFPEVDKKPPPTFEAILETPSAEPASLNIGNQGSEAFLCISKAPGTPITGLTICNESEDYILPEDFKILELSPSGEDANINRKAGGDEQFLAYAGGHDSYFGYDKECIDPNAGLLRIEMVEGRNLVAADLGGTSDPFAELVIGEKIPKKGSPTHFTRVIEKTLTPLWEEKFVFRATRFNILTLNVYDKDKIEIAPEFLGRAQISLDTLVMGQTIEQWIPLQHTSRGEVFIRISALDFGLPADQPQAPLVPLDAAKYNSAGLIAGIGGIGMRGIKGAAGLGTAGVMGVVGVGEMGLKGVANVGEMGLKGVTNVGELGLKGVTNVGEFGMKGVSDVGELGMKGVTGVGELGMKGVSTVTGAVGGLFGRTKSKKSVEDDKEKGKGGFFKSHKKHAEVACDHETAKEISEKHEEPNPDDQLVERMPITREGVLEKSGGGVLKLSHKKFCVLHADSFLVFKSKKDYSASHAASDTYPLGQITVAPSTKHQHTFEINEKGSHTSFKCSSEEELQLWLSAINNNILCMKS